LPPSGSFAEPTSVVTDSYGNIYVASFGQANDGSEGRIDIFDSSGLFLTELADPDGPRSLALDSVGTLYVANGIDANEHGRRVVRYVPTGIYDPANGEIAYGNPPVVIREESFAPGIAVAVNAANEHLFEGREVKVVEYGSAAEGNPELGEFGEGSTFTGTGLAIDAAHGRIYASAITDRPVVKVFELASPHEPLPDLDGSTLPGEKFPDSFLSLGVDEGNGHLFVYDGEASKLFELTESGGYVETFEHGFQANSPPAEIGVDNGENSPNGALNPRGRYVFVPSNPNGVGHSYAFGPLGAPCEPSVTSLSFAEVSETEAELRATVNPCNLETSYAFEYVTEAQFDEEGFGDAQVAGSGQVPAAREGTEVSASAEGLSPDTAYRFRVLATNEKGSAEAEGSFSTYPAEPEPEPCPNAALRTGFSALLPDCRAYELVTPPDTNSRTPLGLSREGLFFTTREASPAGAKVSFRLEGGTLPGIGGTGSPKGDPYLSTRGADGWSTSYVGPSPSEAPDMHSGSHSPDQGYSFWDVSGEGSALVNGNPATYIRYPDGHSALIGRGSLDTDPQAKGDLISENGSHIIFDTRPRNLGGNVPGLQLEPNAPPSGTVAIYDRTPGEVTHVVSLLPGDVTPGEGEDASYEGASLDGRGVAFTIGSKLYLRFDDAETYEVGEGVTFEGVAEGSRVFYLEGGNFFRFDAQTESVTQFSTSADVTPVNISKDGSTAYFVSPSVLTEAANSNGDKAVEGGENLYLSREGAIGFVGTVTERDVVGENPGEQIDGLGLWTAVVGEGRLGADPSRVTPDGNVLLFQSRANLAGYDPQGHTEIYRYDSSADELTCLACNPTGAVANSDATLQRLKLSEEGLGKLNNTFMLVNNLRSDGRRAFFESSEALVARDTDQLQDVYEWDDEGVGTCDRPGGCIFLISSGHSLHNNYLHAVSDSGDDLFFVSSDLLLGVDSDETPSIYDARVGGGFPEPNGSICEAEGCRGSLTPPPVLPAPTTPALAKGGKVSTVKHCPKGKRRVKRHGRVRCVKRHHKHHRGSSAKKGARR